MSGHTESTSNSTKFAPMPMSALLANLMPLPAPPSADSSYTSADDSETSFSAQTAKKSSPKTVKEQPKEFRNDFFSSTPKPGLHNVNVKDFSSEKKSARKESNKENCNSSNRTYPNKEQINNSSHHKPILFNELSKSDVKKRSVLTSVNNVDVVHKRTPEIVKSCQKVKPITPVIKSGIRKYTPGSVRRSQKKTPSKVAISKNGESAKCLFPENPSQEDQQSQGFHAPHPRETIRAVPETPMNRKPLLAPFSATPSYPQGVIGNHSKMTLKTTSIKGKNYIYIKKIGVGGSSEVYKVIEVGTSSEYAVKCVDLATDKELAQGYINEVRLLRELQNSDRVIRLYDYEYDRANQFLRVVLEVGETDLSSFLRARGAGLPPALVLHYWEEMLHAVHYIHENGVIHADLKPANFLLVCGKLKLIDFGIASAVASDATSVVRAHATGTYSYISPEALAGGAGGYGAAHGDAPIKISFRSDVWSLGCILYSMVYGKTPFSHIPNLAKLAAILDPNHNIQYPDVTHLPESLISALKWCLTYNAKSRPWVRELLAIPYLQAPHSGLPPELIDKLRPIVTTQELRLLQRARVQLINCKNNM